MGGHPLEEGFVFGQIHRLAHEDTHRCPIPGAEIHPLIVLPGMMPTCAVHRHIGPMKIRQNGRRTVGVSHEPHVGVTVAIQLSEDGWHLAQKNHLVVQAGLLPQAQRRPHQHDHKHQMRHRQRHRPAHQRPPTRHGDAKSRPGHKHRHETEHPVQTHLAPNGHHCKQQHRKGPQHRQRPAHTKIATIRRLTDCAPDEPRREQVSHHQGEDQQLLPLESIETLVPVDEIEHDVGPTVPGVEPQVQPDAGQRPQKHPGDGPPALTTPEQHMHTECDAQQRGKVFRQKRQPHQRTR